MYTCGTCQLPTLPIQMAGGQQVACSVSTVSSMMATSCYVIHSSCAAQHVGPPVQSSHLIIEGPLLGTAQTPKQMAAPLLRPPPGTHEMRKECLCNSMASDCMEDGHTGAPWAGVGNLYTVQVAWLVEGSLTSCLQPFPENMPGSFTARRIARPVACACTSVCPLCVTVKLPLISPLR